jgi:hypothetical protein
VPRQGKVGVQAAKSGDGRVLACRAIHVAGRGRLPLQSPILLCVGGGRVRRQSSAEVPSAVN